MATSDGYSGKILGIITMPVKNNILIYENLFRLVLLVCTCECQMTM